MHDLTFKTSDGCSASIHMVIVSAGSVVFNGTLCGSAEILHCMTQEMFLFVFHCFNVWLRVVYLLG